MMLKKFGFQVFLRTGILAVILIFGAVTILWSCSSDDDGDSGEIIAGIEDDNHSDSKALELDGYWDIHGSLEGEDSEYSFYMSLTRDGNDISGSFICDYTDAITGTIDGSDISLAFGEENLIGTVRGARMTGTFSNGTWEANRLDENPCNDGVIGYEGVWKVASATYFQGETCAILDFDNLGLTTYLNITADTVQTYSLSGDVLQTCSQDKSAFTVVGNTITGLSSVFGMGVDEATYSILDYNMTILFGILNGCEQKVVLVMADESDIEDAVEMCE